MPFKACREESRDPSAHDTCGRECVIPLAENARRNALCVGPACVLPASSTGTWGWGARRRPGAHVGMKARGGEVRGDADGAAGTGSRCCVG